MELSSLARIALVTTALGAPACMDVVGTKDFEPCQGAECDDGAGGGDAGTTSSSATSTIAAASGSTGTGTATCVQVTVVLDPSLGDVKVELLPEDVDFEDGTTSSHCIPFGSKTISAECDPDEGDRFPLDVDWGNPLCARGSSCSFELTEPQEFAISGASCR